MGKSFRTLILAMAAVLAAAVSCTESLPKDIEDSKVCLKIGSVTTSELTKSAIEGAKFPTADAASIGIFVGDTKNAVTTKAAGSDTWSDPQIELPAEESTLYGYYPYSEDVTSISSIPVSSSVDGDDWMWATPVAKVSSFKPKVSLSMNHALALVEVTFNITGYAEGAGMTALTLTAGSFSQSGSLDAADGTVTIEGKATAGCQLLADNQTLAIKDGKIVAKCLLVPAGREGRQDMTIACTLDGKNLKASLTGDKGVLVKSGTKSTVSLNVKGTTMEVDEVGIEEWNSDVGGGTATIDGYTVTLGGDVPATLANGTFAVSGTDSDFVVSKGVIVRYDKSDLVNEEYTITYTLSGSCSLIHDEAAGEFILTDIITDITLNLFKEKGLVVNIISEGNGNAYAGNTGTTRILCPKGHSVTISAEPDAGERILEWQDGGGNTLGTGSRLDITPTDDITVKCIFTTYALSGIFTVNSTGKKVCFSRGNLFYDGAAFGFEDDQLSYATTFDTSHVSHFFWTKTASTSFTETYTVDDESETDILFTNHPGFAIDGIGTWHVLTKNEMTYLLDNHSFRQNVTVCGNAKCLVILPDGWSLTSDISEEYSETTTPKWSEMEAAGAVCLPAAGYRSTNPDNIIYGAGRYGQYWYSAPSFTKYVVYFLDISDCTADYTAYRTKAQSVRLVTTLTE